MSGYTYDEKEPTAPCPYCGTETFADFVDIGVGMQQCMPFHCDGCGASEIGGFDPPRELSPDEKRTGWYAPGQPPSTLVPTLDGEPVFDHREALALYGAGLLDDKETP